MNIDLIQVANALESGSAGQAHGAGALAGVRSRPRRARIFTSASARQNQIEQAEIENPEGVRRGALLGSRRRAHDDL